MSYNSQLLPYKGYTGSVEYSEADETYFGKIENIADLVNYEGNSLEELEKAFHEAVDDYEKSLIEMGKK